MTFVNRVGIHPNWPLYYRLESRQYTRDDTLDYVHDLIREELVFYVKNGFCKEDLKSKEQKDEENNLPFIGGIVTRQDLGFESSSRENSELSSQEDTIAAEQREYEKWFINEYQKRPAIGWIQDLKVCLQDYAYQELGDWYKKSLASNNFEQQHALLSFVANYTRTIILAHCEDGIDQDDILNVAFGVLICSGDEPWQLARVLLKAYDDSFYKKIEGKFPIAHFILRVLADYLGEKPINLIGEVKWEPVFSALFDHWKTSDLPFLNQLCLAACDAHTHRAVEDGHDQEVVCGFERFPLEILFLFHVREKLGLANPIIDHPLMYSVLAVLPKPLELCSIVNFDDKLLRDVRLRMKLDDYDEQDIINYILTGE